MKKTRLWTLAVLFYVLFIYSNSMKPAELSSQDSGQVLRLLQDCFYSAGISAGWLTDHIIRKTAHFSEYALLGLLLTCCMKSYGLNTDRRWLIHSLSGFLIPFLDETIQLFVAGRSGQISDVWLDCFGVLFGTGVSVLFFVIRKKTEKMNVKKLSDSPSV